MPPEPRRPGPPLEAIFLPPEVEPRPVHLTLTDVLSHLSRSAEAQTRLPPAVREEQGLDAARTEELNRRLANVTRLVAELQAELEAVEALRPPDPTAPVIT